MAGLGLSFKDINLVAEALTLAFWAATCGTLRGRQPGFQRWKQPLSVCAK